jgi:CDP-paratose 2-epimerase
MKEKKKILVTGGLGFIGTNLSIKLIKKNYDVIIIDNGSRKGNYNNLNYLRNLKTNNFYYINQDLTKNYSNEFQEMLKKADCIFHLAAQVAVTKSLVDPKFDYLNNIDATFRLLEAFRKFNKNKSKFIYASTNKVYGRMKNIKLLEKEKRYLYSKKKKGINEHQQLDFYSPYGCSKGSADTYVIDYGRSFNLDTISFRQSCIYGNFQYGVEDQGWLAWMAIASLMGKTISIYGNGKQVRDALHVDDLTDLYCKTINAKSKYFKQAYNVGGGFKNSISILEFLDFLLILKKKNIEYKFFQERQGDQKIYISDIQKLKKNFNWEPKIKLSIGLKRMYKWIENNLSEIRSVIK